MVANPALCKTALPTPGHLHPARNPHSHTHKHKHTHSPAMETHHPHSPEHTENTHIHTKHAFPHQHGSPNQTIAHPVMRPQHSHHPFCQVDRRSWLQDS